MRCNLVVVFHKAMDVEVLPGQLDALGYPQLFGCWQQAAPFDEHCSSCVASTGASLDCYRDLAVLFSSIPYADIYGQSGKTITARSIMGFSRRLMVLLGAEAGYFLVEGSREFAAVEGAVWDGKGYDAFVEVMRAQFGTPVRRFAKIYGRGRFSHATGYYVLRKSG